MEQENRYVIYTDASFDDQTSLATYAIVTQYNQQVIQKIARQCEISIKTSLEAEIIGIYQAMNSVLINWLNVQDADRVYIRTDCRPARDFLFGLISTKNIFKKNPEMIITIRNVYHVLCRNFARKHCNFSIKCIPRCRNTAAHDCSYQLFRKLKKEQKQLQNKPVFLESLAVPKKRKIQVMMYLLENSNGQGIVQKTQSQIATQLTLSISTVNRVFKELMQLQILQKLQNGKYSLLV